MHRTKTTAVNFHVSGSHREIVAANVGEDGAYENFREYIRDLMLQDKERANGLTVGPPEGCGHAAS